MNGFKISEKVYLKRIFNPFSKEDLLEFKRFRNKPSWPEGCPYALEAPYTNIPEMMMNKIIDSHIDNLTGKKVS